MAQEFLNVKITLDTGEVKSGIVAIEKQVEETSKKSDDSLSGSFKNAAIAVTGINQALELADKAMTAVVNTGKALFEQVLKGEEITAISKRFEILAESAGQVPSSLVSGIESAIDGTVDMEDALKIASESLVKLGANADKIPQIFELARKTALVFGGSTEDAFEKISTAIATGQTRQLKSIGLIVDSKKAQEDYAKTIGLTASVLTEEQKSLAVFNATLEKGNEKFKGISGSLTPVSEEFKRFKVQLGEVFDAIALGFNSVFGDAVKASISGFTTALKTVSNELRLTFDNSLTETDSKVLKLQQSIQGLNAQLKLETEGTAPYQKLNSEIERLQGRLDGILERQNKVNQLKINTNSESVGSGDKIGSQLSDEAIAKRLASESEINKLTLDLQNQSIQDQLKNADFLNLSLLDKKNLYLEQITLETETLNAKLAEIDLKYANQGVSVQESANELKLQNELAYKNRIKNLNDSFNKESEKSTKAIADKLSEIGKQAALTLGNKVGNAFQDMGKAFASGENGIKAFVKSFKVGLADMASSIGDTLIATGIGWLFLIGTPQQAAAPALIGAGVGLKLLAGLLGGSSASNATPVTSADAGGSFSGSSSSITSLATQDQVRQPDTRVVVNIQGSIYDSADTGSRIVDLINSSFDKTGSVITRGAVA